MSEGEKSGQTVLEGIVAAVSVRLAEEKKRTPQDMLERRAEGLPHPPSLAEALRGCRKRGAPGVIAELKKGSPSRGLIREHFPVVELAQDLERHGAAALSVLTEPDFFLGSPEYLVQAVTHVSIPVLRKDFIIDPYQLYQARIWGASSVLLIAAALTPSQFTSLHTRARMMAMDVLCEVHNEHELKMVVDAGAEIIGVNSRNLKTLEVDLSVAERMLNQIPKKSLRVAESGVKTADDMRRLASVGADAFLIGETLMQQAHPGAALQNLLEAL